MILFRTILYFLVNPSLILFNLLNNLLLWSVPVFCRLVGNPYCEGGEADKYCIQSQQSNSSSYSTETINCVPALCKSDQTSSPNCVCAYPYQGHLYFRAPSFSNLEDSSIYISLQSSLMIFFQSRTIPVDSLFLKNPTKNLDNYLSIRLEVFPSGKDRFNRTGISTLGFVFSNQDYKPNKTFGPYYFIDDNYGLFASGNCYFDTDAKRSLS